MGVAGNLKNNISPKARLMLGLTVLTVVGVVTITYMRLNSGEVIQGDSGATLNMPPTKDQISKDRPTDIIKYGDNTAVGEIYKKDEEIRAKEAAKSAADDDLGTGEKGYSSHVDDVRLQMKEAKPPAPVEESPEEASGQSKLQALMEERRKAQEKTASEQNAGRGQQVLAIQENPWKQFLDSELRDANDYELSLQAKVAGIKSKDLQVAAAHYDESVADSNRNNAQPATSNGGSTAGYEQYLNIGKNGSKSSIADASARRKSPGHAAVDDEEDDDAVAEPDYPSERISKTATSKPKANGFVHVGETYYSVLQIGVNTDEISPIRAVSVEKGILDGAIFVGSPARVGEKAALNFTSMSLKGHSYKINAIALDPETYRSGIADGVDNHVISRYTKLGLAAFVDGYAQSLTSVQTTTNTDGSQSSIASQVPNATDQVAVGIGKVGQKMTPIFEREFDQPPTVTVSANRSIVIMFMQELDLNGQSTGPSDDDDDSPRNSK